MAEQKILGENLAAFQLCGDLGRSNDGKIPRSQRIADAMDERQLRTNDSKVRPKFFREGHEALRVSGFDRKASRFIGDTSIARGAPDLFDARALAELPDQGMFAAAAADDEYFHDVPAACVNSAEKFQFDDRRRPDDCQCCGGVSSPPAMIDAALSDKSTILWPLLT
jgi:hypothetical protein